jgi:hypothetical protein
MTTQLPPIPPGPADTSHPRHALARLALSSAYREAADFAAGGVPTVSDEYGDAYDYVDHAARLVSMAQDVVARAVVYARERGGRWDDIAEALNLTAEQARDQYTATIAQWGDALNRTWEGSGRFLSSWMPDGTTQPDQTAADSTSGTCGTRRRPTAPGTTLATTASKTKWSRPTCPSTPWSPR